MKKYTSRATRWMAVASLICGAVLLAGIIFALVGVENIGVHVGFISLGALLGIVFLSCYLAEKSRVLIIDEDKIIFPRGASVDGKMVFGKTVVRISEIQSVETVYHRGDGLISKDTNFYALRLSDGRKVAVTLYAYGDDQAKEILDIIRKA